MKKNELIEKLQQIIGRQATSDFRNFDEDHIEADNLLLEYIDDEEVTACFEAIERWYA